MRFFTLAAVITLLAVASEAKTKRGGPITDREEAREFILERKERHKQKMRNLLEERQAQLADHQSGRSLLSDEDHEKVTRQVRNFERKLNQEYNERSRENELLLEREIDNFLKEQQGPKILPGMKGDF